MRYFIASFLLFISAFSSAQTELLDAKKIWARDSIRLGSNWIRSLSKDTALLTVTDRDIPSAKAVKDFVLNRKSKTDSLLNLKMDKTDSSDLLSKTVRTFGNQSGITGNKTFTNNLTANSFIRASGTPDQLMVANGDVQSKADIHNGAVTFDTTARTLTIPTLSGGSYSVVIPRGTSSGAEGITALSYSRTGNLVTVAGDNGSSTTFSIRDADSSVLAKLSDSTLFNAGRWLPNRSEDSIKAIRALANSKGVGTVTGVTASGPLSSSGGASPNITISQANGSTNGFLSSTDWNTFNNKISYTDALARAALTFSAGSGGYNSSTGVITIPTNTNQITNGAGFITLADSNVILKDRWLPNRIADSLATIRQLANTKGVGTVTSVSASAGTGISVSGSPITGSGTITITNTAPDQVVTLTAGTGISISGTYPNFTVTNSSPSTGGTVTSVGLSAPTGFSVGGSPVTSSGTLALTFASGYSLPTTASQSLWDVAYSKRLSSASLTSSQLTLTLGDASTVTASVPTFNQNTTGTAASLSAVLASNLGGAGATNGILKANGSGVVSAVVASDITSLISGTYVDLTNNQTVAGIKTFTSRIISTGGSLRAYTNGSNTQGAGANLMLSNAAETNFWFQQLNASNNIDWHYFNGSSYSNPMYLTTGGNLGVSGNLLAAGATISGNGRFISQGGISTSVINLMQSNNSDGYTFNIDNAVDGRLELRNASGQVIQTWQRGNQTTSFASTLFGDGNAVFRNSTTNILNIGADQQMYGGTNSDGGVFVYGTGKLHLSTGSARRLTVDGSGNVTINGGSFTVGSTSGTGTGSFFAGAGTFSGNITTGAYLNFSSPVASMGAGTTNSGWLEINSGSNPFNVRVNGGDRFHISPAGNTLIKTITDNGRDALQVAGSASASGTIFAHNVGANIRVTSAAGTATNDGGVYTSTNQIFFANWSASAGILINTSTSGVSLLGGGSFTAAAGNFSSSVTAAGFTVSAGNNVNIAQGDMHIQSNSGFGILSANGSRAIAITNTGLTFNYASSFGSTIYGQGYRFAYSAKSSNYTLTDNDDYINVTSSCTITLPTAVGRSGKRFVIQCVGSAVATIASTSSQTIDGNAASSYTFGGTNYNIMIVYSDGANWRTEAWASGI